MTMRVLVQTVGTGSDKNPVWEALAKAILERQPDKVVQLYTEQSAETLDKARRELQRAGWGEERYSQTVQRLRFDDADDIDALIKRYGEVLEQLAQEHPGAVIEADFTSGTKAMSAAITVAAIEHGAKALLYSVGPRDAGGRATCTERVVTVLTGDILGRRQLQELGRLFNLGHYAAVREQCDELEGSLQDETLEARRCALGFVAGLYDAWDRFDWKAASNVMHDGFREPLLSHLQEEGWDVEALKRQRAWLKTLKGARLGNLSDPKQQPRSEDYAHALVDLYANAQRRLDHGRCDDALARLYRLTEGIGQWRLCEQGQPNPKAVPADWLKEKAPTWFAENGDRKPRRSDGRLELGSRQLIDVLAEMGDPIGQMLHTLLRNGDEPTKKGPLQSLLNRRNRSLLAHGFEPIDRAAVEELRELLREPLAEALRLADRSLEEMERVATFVRCPLG